MTLAEQNITQPSIEPLDQPRSIFARRSDFIELAKVKITRMVIITAYIGYGFANDAGISNAQWYAKLFIMLLGVALACMSASVLNQLYEIDTDQLMDRTKKRPLPTSRISKTEALIFGLALGVLGIALLSLFTNAAAALLCLFTIVSYVLIYTPLKRISPVALLVGAIPGAMPPVIGYAAGLEGSGFTVFNNTGWAAWIIFGIMFVWQVPHFLALAWMYRDDYAKANMPMLPVIDPDGSRTFMQILIGCITLVPLGLLPTMIGISGLAYFFAALICGLIFLYYGYKVVRFPSRQHARTLFLASLVYLPVVLLFMLIDKM
ncbi:Protoheme IX farnesyltransferase 2 [Poriferisphaera corsica]|uniref:Protoheme IX farnesyltransferase n=1 Tax=Poriferisphaera corsica TaxID=2528020 RepID=A0A517YTV0_9BACT|nr:heme o synthase [Poriferisphaera corsica]QDU33651.1 Protoheme IX farnesyltransferase 2 [Poriferisphaera corsica]